MCSVLCNVIVRGFIQFTQRTALSDGTNKIDSETIECFSGLICHEKCVISYILCSIFKRLGITLKARFQADLGKAAVTIKFAFSSMFPLSFTIWFKLKICSSVLIPQLISRYI